MAATLAYSLLGHIDSVKAAEPGKSAQTIALSGRPQSSFIMAILSIKASLIGASCPSLGCCRYIIDKNPVVKDFLTIDHINCCLFFMASVGSCPVVSSLAGCLVQVFGFANKKEPWISGYSWNPFFIWCFLIF